MKIFYCLFLVAIVSLRAAESETMADRGLRLLLERQQELMTTAAKGKPAMDEADFQAQVQTLGHDYELFLRNNPENATGYAAYGYLLHKVGMAKESIAMLMKANQLDANLPLVKNQIGNFLAESGRPLEAVAYYLAAIQLAPKEPLYHYQLGTLLTEARDDFLKSGEWTRENLDHAMHEAFRRAAELAPERIEFTYRYAESFYDLAKPDWDEALKTWTVLEEKATSPIERETMRLHAANILIKQGRLDHARLVLSAVTEEALQGQRQKLVAQLPAPSAK
ncbi:MAG: hypothetical protein KA257_04070 [Opitutaceae bacterium]|nr:hypothetical protein [Opitutaceae bacterium]MBP9914516.1 hypothetical protein [Opitutaceae bacterium]